MDGFKELYKMMISNAVRSVADNRKWDAKEQSFILPDDCYSILDFATTLSIMLCKDMNKILTSMLIESKRLTKEREISDSNMEAFKSEIAKLSPELLAKLKESL